MHTHKKINIENNKNNVIVFKPYRNEQIILTEPGLAQGLVDLCTK